MEWDEVTAAFKKAKQELEKGDHIANDMAHLLIGRLRAQVGTYTLKQLKRELKDFNMHTQCWKTRG